RLADADDVGARADGGQHVAHMVDVVVEVETAFQHRHLAGVGPVGDIDVVVLKEGLDRAAQQGGVVARQRSDDHHGGRGGGSARAFQVADVAGGPHQTAPGRGPDDLFGGADGLAGD